MVRQAYNGCCFRGSRPMTNGDSPGASHNCPKRMNMELATALERDVHWALGFASTLPVHTVSTGHITQCLLCLLHHISLSLHILYLPPPSYPPLYQYQYPQFSTVTSTVHRPPERYLIPKLHLSLLNLLALISPSTQTHYFSSPDPTTSTTSSLVVIVAFPTSSFVFQMAAGF